MLRMRGVVGEGEGKRREECEGGIGEGTIGFFVLLVFPHGFDACSTGEHFVGEAPLVVGLLLILAVDILMSLLSVV